jgi:hypothetical protein
MSRAFRTIAAGGTSRDLPAYELPPPVDGWMRGYLDQIAHWDWEPPPEEDEGTNAPRPEEWIEFAGRATATEPPPGPAYQE